MRLAGVVAAVAAVAVGVAVASGPPQPQLRPWPASPQPAPLLGIFSDGRNDTLAHVDPETLRAVGAGRVQLGSDLGAWAFSADRSRLAIAHVATPPTVRIVDVDRMEVVRELPTRGGTDAVAWLAPDRIAWLEFHRVVVADAATGAVVRTTRLATTPTRVGFAPGAFVLLLATDNRVGAARLAVVDATGAVRSVRLARSGASAFLTGGRQRRPGLAVDPKGRRAYVVGAGEPVAEVDLRTLHVAYHELAARRTALGRLRDWLEPGAAAKGMLDGPERRCLWLGNGLLAVTGEDGRAVRSRRGDVVGMSSTPAGLDVVDVRAWRRIHLGRRTTDVALAGVRLLGYGPTFRDGRTVGAGLDVYRRGGTRAGHLFGTRPVWWTQGLGRTAVVGVGESPTLVDLASVSVVRRLPARVPRLLVGGAQAWVG